MNEPPTPVLPSDGPVDHAIGRACPVDVVVDDTSVTWLDQGAGSLGRIARAPKSGGPAIDLVTVQTGSAIAQVGPWIYYAGRNRVGRVRTDGTMKLTLVYDPETPLDARDVVADESFVYFTAADKVQRVPRSGGAVVTLASGMVNPTGLALADGWIYFTTYGAKGTIRRVPAAGGAIELLARYQAYPTDIAVNGPYIYWLLSGSEGAVMILPRDGSFGPQQLAETRSAEGMTIDDAFVYWTERDHGRVKRVGKRFISSIPSVVVSNEPGAPYGIASDGDTVFWTVGCHTSGRIRRLPDGEAVPPRCHSMVDTMLAAPSLGPISMTGSWIYYAEPGATAADGWSVKRMWRSTGTPQLLASGRGPIASLTADRSGVVWSEASGATHSIVALANESTTPLAVATALEPDLAIDSVWIYFTDAAGRIARVRRNGSAAAVTLASTAGEPRFLARDGDWAFWSEDTAAGPLVRRVHETGGTILTLFESGDAAAAAGDLAASDGRLAAAVVNAAATSRILSIPQDGGAAALLAEGSFQPRDLRAFDTIDDEASWLFTSGGDVTRVTESGRLTTLASGAGHTLELDGDERCAIWTRRSDVDDDAIERVSSLSLGDPPPGEEIVYEALLQPLNDEIPGIDPVSGTARIILRDGVYTIRVEAAGLYPEIEHAYHIHELHACGTDAAADTNADGYLDVVESLRRAGGVVMSLDTTPLDHEDMSDFPIASSDGTNVYEAILSRHDVEHMIDDDLSPMTRSIQLHGADPSLTYPPSVSGIDGVSPRFNLPVACGLFHRVGATSP